MRVIVEGGREQLELDPHIGLECVKTNVAIQDKASTRLDGLDQTKNTGGG